MDPDATLKLIDDLLCESDTDSALEAIDRCRDLARWLDNGGFEPRWEKYPTATYYFGEIRSLDCA